MIAGLSGTLLSHEALENAIRDRATPRADSARAREARRRILAWHVPIRARLGPAAAARTIFDRLGVPLFAQLGYRVLAAGGSSASALLGAVLDAHGVRAAGLVVTAWGRDAASTWREAVRQGIALDVRWCFCLTGPALRIVDSRRTYSRRFIEFAVDATLDDAEAFELFWGLVSADAMSVAPPAAAPLDRAIAWSERHRAQIRDALQDGVEDALAQLVKAFARAGKSRSPTPDARVPRPRTFDEALVVVYRILFLLFAEARGVVPRWHPVFRDGYTIEALRGPVELLPNPRGLWETLQAIARLAHEGCHVGSLRVPPFNGRLFSPRHAPLADTLRLDDGAVRRALLSLTTRRARSGRVRVAYGDLGVEQLGGIYERLLDVEPGGAERAPFVRSESRKTTGSFYTPRSLTEFVVRRTLAPLVREAPPEQILALRVLDPAMGSGAFLVAACRYLASAYEAALVREGALAGGDITEPERIEFRRAIAQRCLFGVDLNPMAVQLGRLSLWLATLAADRPLTFLDHRLRVGNSLVGARLDDLVRQPPSARRSAGRASLPLFGDGSATESMAAAVTLRSGLAVQPELSLADVRAKERALADLGRDGAILTRYTAAADLWCASWFRPASSPRRTTAPFGALIDHLLGRGDPLPPAVTDPILEETRVIASSQRFFHWTLEYPEVFYGADGQPLDAPGFDAVLGNPPWEMLRGDRGGAGARSERRDAASSLTAFARTSGIYRFQDAGHVNLYQLFVERALTLLRRGGRLGLILPSGFALDRGSASLRRAFLDRAAVDGIFSIENRQGVFPIHRSLRFLLLSATVGRRTDAVTCRFGIRTLDELDGVPDEGLPRESVVLSRALLERMSGGTLAVPELRTDQDVAIVSDLTFRWPALGDPEGWHVRFGRELNATDDREHFVEARAAGPRGLPVIEGKHLSPFSVDVGASTRHIRGADAARLLRDRAFERRRLAYRDVAAATNQLSLIAALVPAGVVTTHTLFCLKDPLDEESQHFLCGMLNSFVANYLIRPRISTHVGAGVIDRLPMPRPPRGSTVFRRLAAGAAALAASPSETSAALVQAMAARLYGVTEDQFSRVLATFPLVSGRAKEAAMRTFCSMKFEV